MTAPARPPKGGHVHFRPLDGYRGLAALLIFVAHAALGLGEVENLPTLDANRLSFMGVAMFFTMSGFLLYRPFVAAHLDDRPALPAPVFLRRRLLRIFPLYWVVLTAYLLILESPGIGGVVNHVKMYLLLQIYDPKLFAKGIPAAWTLCVELTFYLAVPLLALGARRLARAWPGDPNAAFRAEAIVIAAFFMLGPVWRVAWTIDGPTQLVDIWLPAEADLFGLGMALALISAARSQTKRPVPGLLASLAAAPTLCLLAAAAAIAVLDAVSVPLSVSDDLVDARQTAIRYAVYVVACALLMIPMVLGDGRNRQARFLSSAPLQTLSAWTYGLYLWHMIVLLQVSRWFGGEDVAPFWPTFAIGLVISLMLAASGYRFIEIPVLRFRDDRGRNNRAPRRRDPSSAGSR